MQKHLYSLFSLKRNPSSFEAFNGSAFATNPNQKADDEIIKKQIEILEDAIERYNKLEEIKKYTKMALEDIDVVTEEDILNALEIEKKISIEDDLAVQKLLESEGLLRDVLGSDFDK